MDRVKRSDLQDHVESVLKKNISESALCFGASERDCETIYRYFLNSGFLSITAPEEDPPMMQFITIYSLKDNSGGKSIKPGNVRLNIRNLIETIPSMTEMSISIALDIPILQICAALNLWKAIKDICTVEISKNQAYLIVSLWNNCDSKHRIATEKGFTTFNALLGEYGEEAVSKAKYENILDSLENIRCVELEGETIWLREWIGKKYIDNI